MEVFHVTYHRMVLGKKGRLVYLELQSLGVFSSEAKAHAAIARDSRPDDEVVCPCSEWEWDGYKNGARPFPVNNRPLGRYRITRFSLDECQPNELECFEVDVRDQALDS